MVMYLKIIGHASVRCDPGGRYAAPAINFATHASGWLSSFFRFLCQLRRIIGVAWKGRPALGAMRIVCSRGSHAHELVDERADLHQLPPCRRSDCIHTPEKINAVAILAQIPWVEETSTMLSVKHASIWLSSPPSTP